MNSGELVKNKRSPKWPAIFLIKGRGGYKPTRNKDRYKPNKNKRPEYLAARPRGGWLFGPEISARRTIVQSDPNHPDLPLRVSFVHRCGFRWLSICLLRAEPPAIGLARGIIKI